MMNQYRKGQNLRVDAAAQLLPQGSRLLDVGCGGGILGLAVNGKFRNIYGVDVDDKAVEVARKNGTIATRVDLNTTLLPFESEFFDAVVFLSVVAYVYDPDAAIQECRRVLRKGGIFIVSTANMRTLGKLWSVFFRGRFPATSKGVTAGYDGGALHYFCSQNVMELLGRAGFDVTHTQGIFYRPRYLAVAGAIPLINTILHEFLAGELMFVASKR